jgi:hypothetical protein
MMHGKSYKKTIRSWTYLDCLKASEDGLGYVMLANRIIAG